MALTSKTLAGGAGATREYLAGSRTAPILATYRTQFLMAAHAMRPEWAAMLAVFAFNGCAHG